MVDNNMDAADSPEIWKDVPGFEGRYQVSSKGRAQRIGRFKWYGKLETGIKPLKTWIGHNGYVNLTMYLNRKPVQNSIHRYVAQAFIPNPLNLPQVNHINGIKHDNRIENLEWCTHRQNTNHAIQVLGLTKTGVNNPRALFNQDDVDLIRSEFPTSGATLSEFARRYRCSISTIWMLVNNKTYIK